MQTVDWIIASVGVAAIVATTLGVVFFEELVGEQDIIFEETDSTLAAGTADVTQPQAFTWDARNNATAASFEVSVTFSGQTLAGGSATVSIQVTYPDGTTQTQTETLTLGQNAQSATGTWTVPVTRFLALPEDTVATPDDDFDATHEWANGYEVAITVTGPSNPGAMPPSQLSAPSYSATVSGTETHYAHRIGTGDSDVDVL